MLTAVLAAGMNQADYPCWARAATGIVLAVIAWAGFMGARAAVRQHRDGRARAATLTGSLSVVGVVVAVVVFWMTLQVLF